jgi:hypothetical protein
VTLSNAMKVSQLIRRLEQELETHGDLDVVLCVSELGGAVAVDGRNLNAALELPGGQKLPRPALVFGLWKDERGRLLSLPGQAYQVSAVSEDGWNYNRDQAPLTVPLTLWKRYGGQDDGHRNQNGKWFVTEGGQRPVEIVAEGILAWRARA